MRAFLSTAGEFLRSLSNFFRCELWDRRNCRACRAAATHQPVRERAARIHTACHGQFACERFSLGPRCPGPVADVEYLNLIITDPQAVDPRSGKLLPVLVTQVDGNGVSVLRDGATDEEFHVTYAEMKRGSDAKGRERFLYGVCRFLAGEIRHENNQRFLGVYATALAQRRHHADVLAPPVATRREQEARKKRIIDKIGPRIIDGAEFRGGALSRYSRAAAAAQPGRR